MAQENIYYATGKRKSAIARTWLTPGSGQITVNKKPADEYFRVDSSTRLMVQPFSITNTTGKYDVKVTVIGGGESGQAGAIRHGITKALILSEPELRIPLKKAGFVKREPRVKERKKYGQRGARARFQFSKR
jgi:small subunit ribosomal protein S9